jgi:hypothetical protein
MGGLRIRWKILHLVIVSLRKGDEGVGFFSRRGFFPHAYQ